VFNVLIYACVWLDLATDSRQASVIGVVEEMVKRKSISLIVPSLVLDKFRRNRARIVAESTKSLSSHFRFVKDAMGKITSVPSSAAL